MQQMVQTLSTALPAWLSHPTKYSLALMLDHLSEDSEGAEREVTKPPPKRVANQ